MKKNNLITFLLSSLCLVWSIGLNAQKQEKTSRNFGQSAFYEQIKEKAQESNGKVKCAAYEYDQFLNSANPKKETINEFESWLAPKIKQYKQKKTIRKTTDGANVITIPVVVHVIHDNKAIGVAENITDAQVISQITVLNQDFRKMLGTPGHNTNPVGADVEIEFCLAQRTPDGQATNGINRLNIPTPDFFGFPTWSMDQIEGDLKPSTVWDSDEYLNIWVVDNIFFGMVAGYAQFPVSSGLEGLDGGSLNEGAETDGVVIGHNCFGSSDLYPAGTYVAPYDKGRTTTHEVGHWLGLRHIWGDNSSCDVDATDSLNDYCLDTPPADDANDSCSQTSTCTAPSMLENYMDYTGDACQNIFTEDQKTRMRTVLDNSPRRISLVTSSGCLPPTAFDAKVGNIDLGSVCQAEVAPVVTLSNVGTSTVITSATISYGIEGEGAQTYNWTGTLDVQESIEIMLPVIEFQQTSHFTVTLIDVNGTIDDNTLNNSTTAIKTVSPVPTFVSTTVILSLTTDDYGDETSWELINNNTGTTVAQGGDYPDNQTFTFNFELTSGDCYTFTIYDEYQDGICCDFGIGSYTLTAGSEVIVSGGDFGASESTSFVIDTTASVVSNNPFEDITLYPNPVNSTLNIGITGTTELPENIFIYNTLGQLVKNSKVNSSSDLSVDVSSFANGIYLIKITGQNQSKTLRFIKQ